MAKPNYAFQKRQRELAKKQKKEEKRLRKTEPASQDESGIAHTEGVATAIPVPPGEPPAQPANGGDSKA